MADLVQPVAAASNLIGSWSVTYKLPIIPIAAALLSNGDVIAWSSDQPINFQTDIGTMPSNTLEVIFDPRTGTSSGQLDTGVTADMFCPGVAYLPDGRLLVNGGSSSSHTALYDPVKGTFGTWSDGSAMNIARGYNGSVTLSTGKVFTIGGSWSGGTAPKDGELWSPNTGWKLTGISVASMQDPVEPSANHAWLFAMPGGRVFQAGPSRQMNWYDPEKGTTTPAGSRGDDMYSIYGDAVMYAPGKILKVGGDPSNPVNNNSSALAYVIDVTQDYIDPNAAPVVHKIAPLHYARTFANGVVLPDGEVFIVGGQSQPQQFSDSNAVLIPEMFNPVTETFADLAPMPTPRDYHSTALLLTDGRIMVGGGGGDTAKPNANHEDYEIYTPAYLLAADGSLATRPTITSAPGVMVLGTDLVVQTIGDVTGFTLLHMGATTHDVDTNQRRIPLTIAHQASNGIFDLTAPSDPGVTVPGLYMLFALDKNNVPSIAKIVQVKAAGITATVTALSADTGAPGDFITKIAAQTVSGTLSAALADGETVQVSTDGVTWLPATATGTTWSAAGVTLPNGAGTLSVRTVDTAGYATVGTGHGFTLDTAAPTATATVTALSADTGAPGDFITNIAAQTVSGTLSAALADGEIVQVSTDGVTWLPATATGTTWSAAGVTLPNGAGTLSVRTIDVAGNATAGTGHGFTLDTAAPAATATVTALSVDTGAPGDFITKIAAQTVSGTLSAALADGETVQVGTDGVTWLPATATGTTWSAAGVTLPNGAGTLSVRTIGVAGNATAGTGHGFTLDTAAPTATATVTALSADTGAPGDFITNIAAQTVSGTLSAALADGEMVQVSTDGVTWLPATATGTTWSAARVTLPDGAGTLSVRTIDVAGNATAGTGHGFVLDTTSPTVTVVTALPVTGNLHPGQVVTLTVALSEAVEVNTVGGTPTLQLNDGGTATYLAGSGSSALTFSYTVAAGQNTADLAVTGSALNGAIIQDGAGNAANLASAVTNPAGTLQVSTVPPASLLTIADTSTNSINAAAVGNAYTGPVDGLAYDYVTATSDGLNVTTTSPNWFIHTGSGTDAIDVSRGGGNNVLDGSTGSNFLTGGSGKDTFFVDDRGATSYSWSTIVGFHAGDNATIWGVTPSDFNLAWIDNQGAVNAKGLTGEFTAAGKATANITLSGFSTADIGHRLSISYGRTTDLPGLPGSNYMLIHGN